MDAPDQAKLFVGGISWDTNEDTLRDHFKKYGDVVDSVIMRDRNTGSTRGFGFVLFSDSSASDKALQDKHVISGRTNLEQNLTLWRLGTLPPALIAFSGHVHPIDPSWHMLGLGYQPATDVDAVKMAAVIHYNGDLKPWLDIGFKELRPFWSKHVNYSNDFIRHCNIIEA